jgi:hypothetical protein
MVLRLFIGILLACSGAQKRHQVDRWLQSLQMIKTLQVGMGEGVVMRCMMMLIVICMMIIDDD